MIKDVPEEMAAVRAERVKAVSTMESTRFQAMAAGNCNEDDLDAVDADEDA
jgi:hypothetical protein